MDLSKDLTSRTRFKLLMRLRNLSPNDRFDNEFVLRTYGIHMRYDMPGRPLVMTGIEISEEDYTALLLRVGV
jgi:hypothetical protein